MRPFRSVGGQLFTALVVVVLVALATTYLMVVPTLERQLVSSRLNELERSIPTVAKNVELGVPMFLQSYAENTASALDARVVVFQSLGPPIELTVTADSVRTAPATINSDLVALKATKTGRLATGTVERDGVRQAEVAEPVPGTFEVLLLSGSLGDAEKSVASVRKQLLVAAIPSILIALGLGALGARRLTSRIQRLERAAERIATGRFEEPVEDEGEDEVGQLARSFENMRLRLAQLDEARREFIANASHELRTPIFGLSGSLELLADEEMDEASRREFVETMRDQVERLRKLATALLDLSRLDAGKLDLSLRPLALAPLAEALKDEFEVAAELSGHSLSINIESEPLVRADEQRTLQIGRIMLENALVHTPSGSAVSIRVAVRGEHGLLIVEDNGQGIPADKQERVFERFFRLEGGRSSGSGLGLAIAREWALKMEGAVTLESQPGTTLVSLLLPGADESD
ncbi:MAG: HAMP domain-containing sensor histidine kinase [Gaiellaceae bacterium]